MVQIEDLHVSLSAYPVIHGVSLDIGRHELLCLLGPSGCGKTTTLRALAGFEQPQQGSIRIDGEAVSGPGTFVRPQHRDIGFMFQDMALFPHLTIADNIGYGISKLDKHARAQRVTELLGQIRLERHANRYPHMLSGGQQQRVALARALAPRPRLMLLDEPFSGLDASLRAHIREETVSVLKAAGVTTVMVTHDPDEAMVTADRIALMRRGSIVQIGTPEMLYTAPADGFTAAFLGEATRLSGVASDGAVDTALTRFSDTGFADNTPVDVFIRPEAVSLDGHDGAEGYKANVRVCSVRFAGASSLVQLGVRDGDGHQHLEARVPRRLLLRVGDNVAIRINKHQTYMFAKDE